MGDFSNLTMGPRWIVLDSSLCVFTTVVVIKDKCWDSNERTVIDQLTELLTDRHDGETYPAFTIDVVDRHLVMFCKCELMESLLVPLADILRRVLCTHKETTADKECVNAQQYIN